MNPHPYLVLTLAFAGLIHGGFSLGTSMLVLLSGHSLSRRRSHARLVHLTASFTAGALLMAILLLSALVYFSLLLNAWAYPAVMLVLSTLIMLAGLWTLFFYFRGGDGTALWIPRGFARYLNERTARTKSGSESFVLGGASVLFELPVTAWLLGAVAVLLSSQGPRFQVAGLLLYGALSITALLAVFIFIGGGHTPGSITRFRARHKRFIQTLVGLSMLLLGAVLFWNHFEAVIAARGGMPW